MDDVNYNFKRFMFVVNPGRIREFDPYDYIDYVQLRFAMECTIEILTHDLIKLRMDALNEVQVKRLSKLKASFKQGLLDVLIAIGQLFNSSEIKFKDKLSYAK